MRGERVPDAVAARLALAGRRPPPLLLLHGDDDTVVTYDNATSAAALWLELLPPGAPPQGHAAPARAARHPACGGCLRLAGRRAALMRLVKVEGLRHAWSGGAPGQAFADPTGPDALKIALRFFSVNGRGLA